MNPVTATTHSRITHTNLDAYTRLRLEVLGRAEDDFEARRARTLAQLDEGDSFTRRIRVATSPNEPCAIASLIAAPLNGGDYQVLLDCSTRPEHAHLVLDAVDAMLDPWARDLSGLDDPPSALHLRLNLERAPEGLDDVLATHGWSHLGGRYEFKTPVEDLTTDWRGPITWRDLDAVGLDLAAATFERAGQGPDWEEDDDALRLIHEYLSADDLVCDPSCLEVGFDANDDPVAFLIAQTAPEDGWCTITFMGLVPEARAAGLGKWVHRRGFELMRRQGGTLYHGGTSATNLAMRRLFATHGCRHHARLAEWRLTP